MTKVHWLAGGGIQSLKTCRILFYYWIFPSCQYKPSPSHEVVPFRPSAKGGHKLMSYSLTPQRTVYNPSNQLAGKLRLFFATLVPLIMSLNICCTVAVSVHILLRVCVNSFFIDWNKVVCKVQNKAEKIR